MFDVGLVPGTDLFEGCVSVLPEGFDESVPDAGLAGFLEGLDLDGLSGFDLVVVLRAYQRLVAHFQACFYELIGLVWEAERGLVESDFARLREEGLVVSSELDAIASSEIRAALTLTRRAADAHLGVALALQDHPEVLQALRMGRLDLSKARLMVEMVGHLTPETARRVIAAVVSDAEGLTTGQLRARLGRLILGCDPEAAKKRYEEKVADRRVHLLPTVEGTANLYALDLPADQANQVMHRINRIARSLNTAGEERTMDQLRADVLLDLLTGRNHTTTTGRGSVDIRVELTTLMGLDEHPGEIPGWGPVIADITRKLADPDSTWRVTITDQGAPVEVVTTRRRPSSTQTLQVHATNPTCVFPGCRMPATHSDLDHTHPWQENRETATHNLAPLCRHDHQNKHHRGWKLTRTGPNNYTWTSPLGHTYITGPDPP